MKQIIVKRNITEVINLPDEWDKDADFLFMYDKIVFGDTTPEQDRYAQEINDEIANFVAKGEYSISSTEEEIESVLITDNRGHDCFIN